MHRIHDVTDARIFRIAEDGAEWIGVTATGTASSPGWRTPLLNPWLYTEKPADNIQDFDFCAEAPTRMAHGGEAPIASDHLIEKSRIEYWGEGNDLAGIRIHADHNEIEARFTGAEPVDPATLPRPLPTVGPPGPGGREPEAADGSLASIVGTRLRVLGNGDRVNPSLSPDRTTVRIDPVTRVIESAWIG